MAVNSRNQAPADYFVPDRFDAWGVVSTIRRHLPLFITSIVVGIVVALCYYKVATAHYTSTAYMVIEPPHAELINRDQSPQNPAAVDAPAMDTQVEILNSHDLAAQVASSLHLQANPEFKKSTSVADDLLDMLTIRREGLSHVISITAKTKSAQLSADIANTYAHQFLQNEMESRESAALGANTWLTQQLEQLRDDVIASDQAVQEYKIRNNLMSANGETMAEQEVSSLTGQIATARADLAEKQARLAAAKAQIARGSDGGDISAALNSEVIKELRRQYADLSQHQAELQTRYGQMYPDVIKVRHQLADIDNQIQTEISRNMSALQADVQIAQQRYNSLTGSQGAAAATLKSDNQSQVGLMELQRKAEASHAVYDSFLSRSKEIAAQSGYRTADARVYSNAQVAKTASDPNLRFVIFLGIFGGMGVGAILVGLVEMLDKRIRTSTQIEEMFGITALDPIPMVKRSALPKGGDLANYIADKPFSVFAESMRNIRANITLADRDKPVKTIAFTSAIAGEGKTVTAISFARALALAGHRVLLIDADQRRNSLTRSLKIKPEAGLHDLLENPKELANAVVRDDLTRLHMVLVNGNLSPGADLMSKEHVTALLTMAGKFYDFIILDTPPILALAESRLLASLADAVILLVRWNKTPSHATNAALNILEDIGARLIGVALTQVDLKVQARIGYGDNSYYYDSVRSYYYE